MRATTLRTLNERLAALLAQKLGLPAADVLTALVEAQRELSSAARQVVPALVPATPPSRATTGSVAPVQPATRLPSLSRPATLQQARPSAPATTRAGQENTQTPLRSTSGR